MAAGVVDQGLGVEVGGCVDVGDDQFRYSGLGGGPAGIGADG